MSPKTMPKAPRDEDCSPGLQEVMSLPAAAEFLVEGLAEGGTAPQP
jgi:hypothetical protein